MTTLEEVFLKVAEIGSVEERESNRQFSRQLSSERTASSEGRPLSDGSVNAPAVRKGYSRDSAIQGERAFFFVSVSVCLAVVFVPGNHSESRRGFVTVLCNLCLDARMCVHVCVRDVCACVCAYVCVCVLS